jgi:uncharacterized protein YlxP (DUF503 family)
VEHADNPKRCHLGVAAVSKDSRVIYSQLDKVVELVRRDGGVSLLTYERELL